MDPALDGYISLEEEATISPPQCVDSSNVTEPWQAKPAADESAPPEADTAEIVEAGVPEEPCFYGHGPTWDNRHWRGWKPRNTPRMPPKRRSTGDTQQLPPPSTTSQVTCQSQEPLRELGHEEFCQKMNNMLLPCDDAERGTFDQQDVFILGDPAASFDLESRLQMTGPMGERTELCFFPATEHTGLHNVHPTWAGTFVLAALGASFPGKHFFLLDSDCLPVTLFEAFDLWQEAYLAPASLTPIPTIPD